jgi:hypothetical protein
MKTWHNFWFRFFLLAGIFLVISAFAAEVNGKNGIWNLLLGCLDLYLADSHRKQLKALEDKDNNNGAA